MATLIPIDEVVHFEVSTHNPTTGAAANADSTPTFSVFEEDTDTPILGPINLTQRTSLTGQYRGSFTASAANGVEAGKFYTVVCSATVGSVAAKTVAAWFRAVPAESVAGKAKVDADTFGGAAGTFASGIPAVNATQISGHAGAADNAQSFFDGTGYAGGTVRLDVNLASIAGSAVSTSTAQLGVNVVNAAGTAWNSGAIGPTTLQSDTITSAKVANSFITANKIGDGSITSTKFADGAITAAKIATDAIDADALATDAVTEIRNGLGLASNNLDTQLTTIDGVVDAIKLVTDLLNAAQAEPAGVPAANATPLAKLGILYMMARNRIDVSASKKTYFDDGDAPEFEKDLSDSGTTYSESEVNAI